ncbi:MAG: anti-sigma factor [Flavobacteriales bacterium]|jgi:hypothetical protein|nr:anti-sigma factor [Flavobacteriales bacterium]
MKLIKSLVASLILAGVVVSSCTKDEIETKEQEGNLKLNFTNLPNLGNDAQYEGWIMVDGKPVSAGVFTVDDNGNMSKSEFTLDAEQIEKASTYVLTIEPKPDNDPSPTATRILAGDFSNDIANLAIDHSAALANNFSTSQGKYLFATPTDTDSTNELSGVWFLQPSGNMMASSLDLPSLPQGWAYEGWAVVDGKPLSTGTFTKVDSADMSADFSGNGVAPNFPGEDFVKNAPNGVNFPVSLLGKNIVISIEPVPDNSPAPFSMKPLIGTAPADGMPLTVYNMENKIADNKPSGKAMR